MAGTAGTGQVQSLDMFRNQAPERPVLRSLRPFPRHPQPLTIVSSETPQPKKGKAWKTVCRGSSPPSSITFALPTKADMVGLTTHRHS